MLQTPRHPSGGSSPPRFFPSRLPRGPHSLTREQVATNQRLRIGIAMLESISERGYVATTVSDVVARAGVSRKAFYQHFANKEACFLAIYDAIVMEGQRRVARAFRDTDGPHDHMETAIRALFEAAMENPHALRLAITEITAVGAAGIERRERLMVALERVIWEGLCGDTRGSRSSRSGGQARSGRQADTTLRAVVGGLNRVLVLYGDHRAEPLGLAADLTRWASTYHPVPEAFLSSLKASHAKRTRIQAMQMGGRAPGTLSPRAGNRSRTHRSGPTASRSFVVHNQRARILDAVTNLTARDGYGALTVEEIAREASVSLQAFYEHFESKEDAFLVAFELGHAKGLEIVEQAFADAPDWRTGVREGLFNLTTFLASEPSFARLALTAAVVATPRANEQYNRGMSAYAPLLAPGFEEAPKHLRPPPIATDAILGGLQELFLHYAIHGRLRELPELTSRATYVALAPFIGAQKAAEVAVGPVGG